MIQLSLATIKLLVESGLEIYPGPCWYVATLSDKLVAKCAYYDYTWRVWRRKDNRYYIVENRNRME